MTVAVAHAFTGTSARHLRLQYGSPRPSSGALPLKLRLLHGLSSPSSLACHANNWRTGAHPVHRSCAVTVEASNALGNEGSEVLTHATNPSRSWATCLARPRSACDHCEEGVPGRLVATTQTFATSHGTTAFTARGRFRDIHDPNARVAVPHRPRGRILTNKCS